MNRPQSNLFFVYNRVDNRLAEPFCGYKPRPDFLATRDAPEPLAMVDDRHMPWSSAKL